MNKRLLMMHIHRVDGTQKNLAQAMGISLSSLNAKINSYRGAEFTQEEMLFIKARYGLDTDEFNSIFFVGLVS